MISGPAARVTLAATALALSLTGCNTGTHTQPTVTLEEANRQLDDYVEAAAEQLPPQTQLEEVQRREGSSCDDPHEDDPSGQRFGFRSYNVVGTNPAEIPSYFDTLRTWWQENAFEIVADNTEHPPRTLRVENDESFSMMLRTNENDLMALTASSPCVWPDGTP